MSELCNILDGKSFNRLMLQREGRRATCIGISGCVFPKGFLSVWGAKPPGFRRSLGRAVSGPGAQGLAQTALGTSLPAITMLKRTASCGRAIFSGKTLANGFAGPRLGSCNNRCGMQIPPSRQSQQVIFGGPRPSQRLADGLAGRTALGPSASADGPHTAYNNAGTTNQQFPYVN